MTEHKLAREERMFPISGGEGGKQIEATVIGIRMIIDAGGHIKRLWVDQDGTVIVDT